MSFRQDMRRFEAKVAGQSEQVIRNSAAALFARIVTSTPFDEGAARGNWQVGIGSAPSGVTDDKDPGGEATISAGQLKTASFTLADKLFYANNLPYIRRLEKGWSGQAPSGMVAANVEDWDRIVDSFARKRRI